MPPLRNDYRDGFMNHGPLGDMLVPGWRDTISFFIGPHPYARRFVVHRDVIEPYCNKLDELEDEDATIILPDVEPVCFSCSWNGPTVARDSRGAN
jgi:hypothetical protein